MSIRDFFKLILFIIITNLAGAVGSIFTTSKIPTWYASINKPGFNPPNWIFGPVWTLLFILMGISAFLIWQHGIKKKKVKVAMYIFGLQLLFNILWSMIFFGLQNPLLAFIEIIILWALILLTIVKFAEISKKAAYLLIPYILWVSFAAILNLFIYLLN
jgi:translocator protein